MSTLTTHGPARKLGGTKQQHSDRLAILVVARVLAGAGLAIDAYVHADLAGTYDHVHGTVSQGTLFRVEAVVAAAMALLVLAFGRRFRATLVLAWLVAVSAFGAVMLYRYVDVGRLGPLPNMYEPLWSTEKVISAIAEAAAATVLTGLLLRRPANR